MIILSQRLGPKAHQQLEQLLAPFGDHSDTELERLLDLLRVPFCKVTVSISVESTLETRLSLQEIN